ncbi:XRE family transcriptional regulator [Thalassospira alkalitolerans]|uniref:helix-turn-helix domain-containing protein n=1 Tax=Thalassospira alkalitolerans TaxID=1293890 RepID=UPI0030EC3CFF|tara:strand:+ start:6428 stop:7507 length:1080 start_codon:yes stop_codon:yes gene_type:complete
MFNPDRLALARKRRMITAKSLAENAGLAVNTISRIESGETPPQEETVRRIAEALDYPVSFFYGDTFESLHPEAVSFRSLTKMSIKQRNAATSAGELGVQLNAWMERNFTLPEPNIPDVFEENDPDSAADTLRQHWLIGERPVGNMIGLLEANGIRVFALAEESQDVDAFSFWLDDRAYIFLNTFKSPERSIFDAAHELGHLVLHRYNRPEITREAEAEANEFASSFLMPSNDVRPRIPRFVTLDLVLKAKQRWRVSAMAMAKRLHQLSFLTDWQYKAICIELGKRGYRTAEPNGIKRETSLVWKQILTTLWQEKTTKEDIAKELALPIDELEKLIGGVIRENEVINADEQVLRLVYTGQ